MAQDIDLAVFALISPRRARELSHSERILATCPERLSQAIIESAEASSTQDIRHPPPYFHQAAYFAAVLLAR